MLFVFCQLRLCKHAETGQIWSSTAAAVFECLQPLLWAHVNKDRECMSGVRISPHADGVWCLWPFVVDCFDIRALARTTSLENLLFWSASPELSDWIGLSSQHLVLF